MKKTINKYLAFMTLALAATSCSNYLDQKSASSMDDQTIFSSAELAKGTIDNIYVYFGETNYRGRAMWYGYNTDIEYYNSSTSADGKADLCTYNTKTSNDQMNTTSNATLYACMYSGIEKANLAIEGLEKSGDLGNKNVAHLLGEALAMRALTYLDLINMWGDVPARWEPITSDKIYVAKSDRDSIYLHILDDMERAINLCAWPNEIDRTKSNDRVNKAFAIGLYARICMQAAGYSMRADGQNRLSGDSRLSKDVLYPKAYEALKELYVTDYASLKPDFADVFNYNGISGDNTAAGSESLFEVPYAEGATCRGRIMYTFGIKHNSADAFTTMIQGSQVGPTMNLFFDYAETDKRRDITCVPFQWDKGVQTPQACHKWSFGKLRYEWANRLIKTGNDDGINKCYMRYSDVLLMMAELANYLEGPSAALPYIKEVRARAFDAADQATFVDAYLAKGDTKEKMQQLIEDERAFEFAGEFVRKADLIRWGKLKQNLDETKARMIALINHEKYTSTNALGTVYNYQQLGSNLYYKYEDYTDYNASVFGSDAGKDAKLVFYGLNKGETASAPEGYTSYKDSKGADTEWLKSSDTVLETIDYLYVGDPEKNMFWPFFNVNMTDNPLLENFSWF